MSDTVMNIEWVTVTPNEDRSFDFKCTECSNTIHCKAVREDRELCSCGMKWNIGFFDADEENDAEFLAIGSK